MNFKDCHFSSIFKEIFNKKIDSQQKIESNLQFSLTPSAIEKTIEKKDEKPDKAENEKNQTVQIKNIAYQPVLEIAGKLIDDNVMNIALTGPFGSGKSSVLMTLQKDYSQFNFLNISLATLECSKPITNSKELPPTENEESILLETNDKKFSINVNGKNSLAPNTGSISINQERDDALNRLIEYSILQQLIYREKTEDLPQSRFKRIRHISGCNSLKLAIGTVLLFLFTCILIEPKFLHVQSLYDFFSCSKSWKIFWDLFFIGYIIFAFIYIFNKLIVKTYNNSINKLNFKDGEIEIAESTSIFNKHLDEIIYFFEVTNYNVVIIEDLDRFDTHTIFIKLRELNHLLNTSNAIERKIKFIYAIKDDIFEDTSRTKFFDYITTVIPVINISNSRDVLSLSLKEKGVTDVTDEVCMDLGIYINDMRILKNIVNEFIQYRQKLDTKLPPQNILAMILYKNNNPIDFASLQKQEGIVYNIISNKIRFANSAIKLKENEIKLLNEEKNNILNFYSNHNGKELRSLYFLEYLKILPRPTKFTDGQNESLIEKIIEDSELFKKLEENKYTSCFIPSVGWRAIDIIFEDIQTRVDPNYTYRQRLSIFPESINDINRKIEKIEQEILELRTLPLKNILSNYPADEFYIDANRDKLITFLIKKGYIDEYYFDYISYFYPGVMTDSDRDFILNIKIGIKKDYNYIIYKPKAVVSEIGDSLFSNPGILNVNLLDCIVETKDIYSTKLSLINQYIKKNNKFDFIQEYYRSGKEAEVFFNQFLPIWKDFFTKGILNKTSEVADINLEILLRSFPKSKISDYQNNQQFKIYISDRFEFIAIKYEIIHSDNVNFLLESLDIKFNKINIENSVSKELMNYIIENNHYTLSHENVNALLKFLSIPLSLKFSRASYSAILMSKNESIIEYVNFNINDCIDFVFSENSIHEDEQAIIDFAENLDIEDVRKKSYLSRQINKITDLSSVNQKHWNIVIESDVIKPNWQNIEKYISIDEVSELSTIIIDYISRNKDELSLQKTIGVIADSTDQRLFLQLFGNNKLPFNSYRQIRKSFNIYFDLNELSDLKAERMEFLIETYGVRLNEFRFKMMVTDFPNLTAKLLLKNKTEYLTNIDLYQIDTITATTLLNSDKFTISELILIIESIELTTFSESPALGSAICNTLNKANEIPFDNDFVIEVIRVATGQQQRLNLFIKKCQETTYNESFVKKGLTLLGGFYEKIASQKGHRPKLSLTKENKILAEYLLKYKFIKSMSEENGKLRINSRNIG
jgi:hypothetical protein